MVESRVLQIVRQFWENAVKLLLENPKNVRDLLALAGADVVKRIDLRRAELVRTIFVERLSPRGIRRRVGRSAPAPERRADGETAADLHPDRAPVGAGSPDASAVRGLRGADFQVSGA